jgi:hypothetical protein
VVKQNVCVVCGTTQNLCFYSIVPRNLLKQIPNVKAGYDTFIMCSHCHCRSQNAHDSLLGTICTELGLVDSKNPKQTEQRAGYELALEMNRPLGALVFHFRGDHKLPQERLDPLFDLVRQRLHLPSETTITLDHVHAAKVEIPPVDNFYKQMVCCVFSGYCSFVIIWRE